MAVRKEEIKGLTKIAQLESVIGLLWACSPIMVSHFITQKWVAGANWTGFLNL